MRGRRHATRGVKMLGTLKSLAAVRPFGGLGFCRGRRPGIMRPSGWPEQPPGTGSWQPSRLRARGARLASPQSLRRAPSVPRMAWRRSSTRAVR